jgi:hypothetical protein
MRNKKTLFILSFFGLFLLLYYIVKKLKPKDEKKPLIVVDDLEQFRVDENGNILVFQNGQWVIQP